MIQQCDRGYKSSFDSEKYVIKHEHDKDIEHIGFIENNVYMIDLKQKSENDKCFLSKDSDPWLWHKRSCGFGRRFFCYHLLIGAAINRAGR